jgi:transposase-like protein
MAQHFLLTAAARTLSLKSIFAAGEDKAYDTFRTLRWPSTNGEPVCPHCGSLDAYALKCRRQFTCSDCRHRFSVTSGTILASRKLKFTDLLAAICVLANAAKGVSALQLARDLDVQHKTAFVLAHKLREAIAAETKGATLSGDVEVDGAYFGGHIRPANYKDERKDRRLAELPNRQAPRRGRVPATRRSHASVRHDARRRGRRAREARCLPHGRDARGRSLALGRAARGLAGSPHQSLGSVLHGRFLHQSGRKLFLASAQNG